MPKYLMFACVLIFLLAGLFISGCGSANHAADDTESSNDTDVEESAGENEGYLPSDVLYLAYKHQGDEEMMSELRDVVEGWFTRLQEIDPELGWLPYEAFIPGSGMTIDRVLSIDAAMCSIVVNPDSPVGLELILYRLKDMAFPTDYEEVCTFIGGPFDDVTGVETGEASFEYESGFLIVNGNGWLLMKMFASLYRLANIYPACMDIEVGGDWSIQDYLNINGQNTIDIILSEVGEPAVMDLVDRAYLLDLLNQAYQFTADITLLEKAAEIAATFPHDNPDEWFDPDMVPLMPDLAMALHHYGWLAEDEDARKSAKYIVKEALPLFEELPQHYRNWMALAHDVVNSKCIHIGIVGPIDDELSWDLLVASLMGWDPRRVAQILDPERDEELIERKGYVVLPEPVAFICIDNMCYPPSDDPDEILEIIREVVTDLAAEAEKEK